MDTSALKDVELPGKLKNERKFRNADQASLVLNAFRLNMKEAAQRVYKFELKFMCTYKKREGEKIVDLSVGPKNDVATRTRKRLLWELFEQMIESDVDFFGGVEKSRSVVYDCGINFYSIVNLLPPQGTKTFLLSKDSLSEISKHYLGRNAHDLSAYLLACGSIELGDVESLGAFNDYSVIQFLEILSNQQLLKEDAYLMFGNRMFKKDSAIKLQGDARILKEGFQKNVRLIGESVEDAVAIMQIDPKKSAFFPECYVHHFLDDYLTGRGDLASKLQGSGKRLAVQQLKGLSVKTTHLKDNRVFVVNDISEDDCNHITFDKDDKKITVTDYFKDTYTFNLRHAHLPCIVEKRGGKVSYYPMEVLKIVAGQRVSLNKQTGNLTEQMIRNCQSLPAKFRSAVEQQKTNACITNSNPFLKAHGIGVDSQLFSPSGQVLYPPAIVYQSHDREEPGPNGDLNWKLNPRRRFIIPATMPPIWAAVIIQAGVNAGSCQDFIRRIVDSGKQRGMNIGAPTRYEVFEKSDVGTIHERFGYFKQNKCKFVMFFTRDKLDPVHHTMKLMEIETGITTQHICEQTMNKALGNKGAFLVIDNVLLKLNMKLGGVNHTLSSAKEFQSKNRLSSDIVAKDWFSASRMFIGIDMSHAGAQSLYDRQTGAKVDPSIVGMAYTVGASLKMVGTYWIQEARVTHVQNLKNPIVKALKDFKSATGAYPRHLIVYRGGVSEGEYRTIVMSEGGAIKEAFQSVFGSNEGDHPLLSIIVVQRNSNYRIVPQRVDERARPFEQNVRPGTVVDSNTMHPAHTEFLLVGHKAIQGTAKPVRCTVIADSAEKRISLEELEYMTYSLCYAHGVVTSPVSVPAPLYSASDLAKRGSNNWKIKGDEFASKLPSSEEEMDGFFKDVSEKIKPIIQTKFWA